MPDIFVRQQMDVVVRRQIFRHHAFAPGLRTVADVFHFGQIHRVVCIDHAGDRKRLAGTHGHVR